MNSTRLQKHYEEKYSQDNNGGKILSAIKPATYPSNRIEAAVTFFPRYFSGGSILELGAGNGGLAKSLLDLDIGIDKYILGDISLPRVMGVAKNLQDDRIEARHVDAEAIGDDEAVQYDAIIMVALIEHLIDPMSAMAGLRKLLKPGGFVYIDTPNIAKYTRRLKLLMGKFPSTASMDEGLMTYDGKPADLYDEGHLHYFTFRSLSKMLIDRCGFSRVQKLGYPAGKFFLGEMFEYRMAKLWPELFSELAVVAYN